MVKLPGNTGRRSYSTGRIGRYQAPQMRTPERIQPEIRRFTPLQNPEIEAEAAGRKWGIVQDTLNTLISFKHADDVFQGKMAEAKLRTTTSEWLANREQQLNEINPDTGLAYGETLSDDFKDFYNATAKELQNTGSWAKNPEVMQNWKLTREATYGALNAGTIEAQGDFLMNRASTTFELALDAAMTPADVISAKMAAIEAGMVDELVDAAAEKTMVRLGYDADLALAMSPYLTVDERIKLKSDIETGNGYAAKYSQSQQRQILNALDASYTASEVNNLTAIYNTQGFAAAQDHVEAYGLDYENMAGTGDPVLHQNTANRMRSHLNGLLTDIEERKAEDQELADLQQFTFSLLDPSGDSIDNFTNWMSDTTNANAANEILDRLSMDMSPTELFANLRLGGDAQLVTGVTNMLYAGHVPDTLERAITRTLDSNDVEGANAMIGYVASLTDVNGPFADAYQSLPQNVRNAMAYTQERIDSGLKLVDSEGRTPMEMYLDRQAHYRDRPNGVAEVTAEANKFIAGTNLIGGMPMEEFITTRMEKLGYEESGFFSADPAVRDDRFMVDFDKAFRMLMVDSGGTNPDLLVDQAIRSVMQRRSETFIHSHPITHPTPSATASEIRQGWFSFLDGESTSRLAVDYPASVIPGMTPEREAEVVNADLIEINLQRELHNREPLDPQNIRLQKLEGQEKWYILAVDPTGRMGFVNQLDANGIETNNPIILGGYSAFSPEQIREQEEADYNRYVEKVATRQEQLLARDGSELPEPAATSFFPGFPAVRNNVPGQGNVQKSFDLFMRSDPTAPLEPDQRPNISTFSENERKTINANYYEAFNMMKQLNRFNMDRLTEPEMDLQIHQFLEHRGFIQFDRAGNRIEPQNALKSYRERRQASEPTPQPLSMNDTLRQMVTRHEGVRTAMYTDTTGHRTVGVGFNLERPDARELLTAVGADFDRVYAGKDELTDDQVQQLFTVSLAEAEQGARRVFQTFDNLPRAKQSALVDLVFNMGEAGMRKWTTLIPAVARNDWATVANSLRNSKWFKQVQPDRSSRIVNLLLAA